MRRSPVPGCGLLQRQGLEGGPVVDQTDRIDVHAVVPVVGAAVEPVADCHPCRPLLRTLAGADLRLPAALVPEVLRAHAEDHLPPRLATGRVDPL